MIQKVKSLIVSLAALVAVATPALVPAAVYADDITSGLNCGANLNVSSISGSGTQCASNDTTDPGDKLNSIIKLVINIFSLIVGVVAVIMIIIGGLKYITSGGDSGNVTGAKNTILYAVIGLVVVALAQFIVKFVLSKVSQ